MQHPVLENARFCFMKRADAQKLTSFQGLVSSAFWYDGMFPLLMREFQQVVGRLAPTRMARGFPGVCGFSFPSIENGMRAHLRGTFLCHFHFVVELYDKFDTLVWQACRPLRPTSNRPGARAKVILQEAPPQFGTGPQLVNLIDNIRRPRRHPRVGGTIEP